VSISPISANLRHHAPERANVVEGRRVTIPSGARETTAWSDQIKSGATVVYEMTARGRVRMRAGDTLTRAIKAASDAGDGGAATRLTAFFIEGTWQNETRVTLPEPVTDRLFGAGVMAESFMVWGTPDAIELWSDEYWMSQLDHIAQTDAKYGA
jgi:hypothetical protein